MKALLAIAFFAGAVTMALSAHTAADVAEANKSCLADVKISEKDAADFYGASDKFDNAPQNIKCHIKCLMEKLGHIKNGAPDAAAILEDAKLIPVLAKLDDPKAIEACKGEKGADDCDTAFKFTKCLRNYKK